MSDFNLDDLEEIKIPFTYKKQKYVLREASGEAGTRWRNARLDARKHGPDGTFAGFVNLAGLQPLLVSLCVFKVDDTGAESPVGEQTIRTWQDRAVSKLFEKAKEISGLLREETTLESLEKERARIDEQIASIKAGTDTAKNSSSGTTAGSE